MAKSRRISKKNNSVIRPLESLEDRRLMTITGWDLVSTSDSVYTQIPVSGPQTGSYYSIRALVEYYNTVYNGESTQPFTIQLGNGTYTLSETTSTSNLWGGRLDNNNQYGDLDVNPLNTTAPLIIQGVSGGTTVITCSGGQTSSGVSFGLDRLIQVESGSLQVQNLTLKYGQALDNGTTNKETSGLGGAVLVNPGGALSLTNCVVSSNSAGAATNYSYASGLNAAGGGLYGSPGSTINIIGNTSFIGNDVKAGKGGTSGSTGQAGGNAYGAGIAIDAPVPDNITDVNFPTTMVNFNGGSGQNASFLNNRLNSLVASNGKVVSSGGTGGAGTGTGGAGGNAYGAGLYVGSGQLNLNGGSTNSPITFVGNLARGGLGASTKTDVAGANGTAYGAGVYFMPSQVAPVANSPSSGGIMQFSNNTASGATSGIYMPTVETGDVGYTSANGSWTLRTAVAALNPLVATGMNLSLNLPAGNISLVNSTSGSNTGSISVSNTGAGSLTIIGASESGSIISNSNLTTSMFSLTSADVTFSNLTITGANTTGYGGAITQSRGTSTLNDVTLSYNKSGNGGAFYSYGGSFTMIGGSVIGNSAPSGSGGGFFFNGGMAASLSDVNVSNNSATTSGGWGGGILQDAGGTLSIKNNTLIQNNSAPAGAGLYVTGSVVINGGKISDNIASAFGGGVVISTGGSVDLTNVSVVSNKVASGSTPVGTGGGIYQGNASLNLLGSTVVENNSAGNYGGVFSGNSKLIATGTKFSGNSAYGYGGGLGVTNGGTADLSGVSFSGNTANNGLGGGIYQNGGTVNIKNGSKFKSNSASQGGAAYCTNGNTTMNGGVVQNNKAFSYGGGLLSFINNLNVTGVSIVSNSLSSGGSPSGCGGGLSQTGGGTLNLKNSVVKNNSAAQGGGLFFYTSTLNVSGSSFKLNNATSVGAGIYARTNTKAMNFTSAKISSNTISGSGASSGAGIYVSGGTLNTKGNFNLKNNNITSNNNSTIQGAGIYASGTTINFNGADSEVSMVSNNTLNSNGTAIGAGLYLTNISVLSLNNNNLSIANNTINSMNGNSPANNGIGAGIAFTTGATISALFSNLTFSQNSASAGGNDVAFEVAYVVDNNTPPTQNGPIGISYFTNPNNNGSLRSAITYAQTWMNCYGTICTSPTSLAIMLPSTSYEITSSLWQLVADVPAACELTIIGTGSSQTTITTDGGGERVFYVGGSGSLVLQNLIVTGGYTVNSGNGGGGGIYLTPGATLTLNMVSVTGNTAGFNGTASAGANSAGTRSGHAANGGNGANGASGYGGGIYMAGGTLNLLSNSSVTGNYVYGQNGGKGGNGAKGSASASCTGAGGKIHDTKRTNGGTGGSGGTGGNAEGGGIYQAGGTINLQSSNSNQITNNKAYAGIGGKYGDGGGGSGTVTIKCTWGTFTVSSEGGSNGSSGANGTSIPDFAPIPSQVYYSSTSISVQSESISAASLRYMPIKNIEMDLYSANGVLLAVAMTDATGQYHFDTSFTGMGYVEVKPPSTHKVAPKGTSPVRDRTSSFDPISGKSDLIQFLSGEPLNQPLDLVLSQIESGLIVKANSISLNQTDTHSALWKTQLMPKSYHGGFTVSTFDVNKDTTSDYVLITKTGKPMAFIVDGRTGRSTKLSGQVASNLRNGFVVQTANVQGDSTKELVLAPSRERSGRISVIDLQAKKILWNATDFVLGGMKINQIGADPSGHSEYSSFQLVSQRQNDTFKILDGATGKLLETVSDRTRLAEKRQAMKAEKMQSASIASVPNATQPTGLVRVSIPRRRLPVMN